MKKLLAIGLLCISGAAHAVTYNVSAMSNLSGSGQTGAYGINDSGQVVGNSYNSATGQVEAVVWNNGVIQSLGFQGIARAVNNYGTVVGETGTQAVNNKTGSGRAYKWDTTNGYLDLGDLNGLYAGAWDINDSGVITGNTFYENQTEFGLFSMHAFRWENGTMTDLPPPTAGGYSRAQGINESGEIVGRASITTFTQSEKHAAYWDGSNNFTHRIGPGEYSNGKDINDLGTAVGIARNPGVDQPDRAAIWDAQGNLSILGTLGGSRSLFNAINNNGVAVGMSFNASEEKRAMISFDGATLVDLNSIIDLTGTGFVTLDEAWDINQNGDIVGVGTLSNGDQGAFLLSAVVPIPAAVWLFASGLGLLGWLRRARPTAA